MPSKRENKDYTAAVGKRKRAVANVRILKGSVKGIKITVNGRDYKEYFPYFEWQELLLKPLHLAGRDNISISIHASGGGFRGQVEAARHGISRALLYTDDQLRTSLKKEGLLTRDDRRKERKKPGLRKARRAPQWSKR